VLGTRLDSLAAANGDSNANPPRLRRRVAVGGIPAVHDRLQTAMARQQLIDLFRVKPGAKVRLADYDTGWAQTKELKASGKGTVRERAAKLLEENRERLSAAQELLYADDRYAVLVVLQALDAAGKDGTIKHVMSGLNPQGCQVFSFKKPSTEELDHNFLWRYARCVPERGRIGIFNRSYYEDVLVVKVHPELLDQQRLPPGKRNKAFWNERYDDINAFERHLTRNGTIVLKFFLNVSRDEQKRRFLERLERPEKNWKFTAADLAERAFWDDYMSAYEDALSATSTEDAPWYVVPADHKWATRTVVADILTTAIRGLDLKFPEVTAAQRRALADARAKLLAEQL
jgi:PPK2 family polyphosphate:nucleotide phosphotransferase